MPDFATIQASVTLYASGVKFRNNRFLGYFLGEHPELFDGDPISLDQPEEDNHGLRAILASQDGLLRFYAYSSRVVIERFWDQRVGIDLSAHLNLASRLFGEYLDLMTPTPRHIICNVSRCCPDEAPARSLSRYFCRDEWLQGPIENPASFAIHVSKRYTLSGSLPVGSLFHCSSERLAIPETQGESRSVVSVEQQIATIAEGLDRDQVGRFLATVTQEMDSILQLYFPSDEGARS